jgi:hypothetical protein
MSFGPFFYVRSSFQLFGIPENASGLNLDPAFLSRWVLAGILNQNPIFEMASVKDEVRSCLFRVYDFTGYSGTGVFFANLFISAEWMIFF